MLVRRTGMIKLRGQLKILIEDIHPSVYYQNATKDTQFPYVVYDLPNSFTNQDQDIFNLDIDIWDNEEDTTNMEKLATIIWRELHRYRYIDEDIQFTIYRMNRLNIVDDDKRIKRRKLIFQVRYYDRRV